MATTKKSLVTAASVAAVAGIVTFAATLVLQEQKKKGARSDGAQGSLPATQSQRPQQQSRRKEGRPIDFFETTHLRKEGADIFQILDGITSGEISLSPPQFQAMVHGMEALAAMHASLGKLRDPVTPEYRQLVLNWKTHVMVQKDEFFRKVANNMLHRPLSEKKEGSFNAAAWSERNQRLTTEIRSLCDSCMNRIDLRLQTMG